MNLNFRPFKLACAAALCALPLSAPAQTPAAAARAVRSFYQYHFAHDRGFLRANVERRRRWLTPELYGLMVNEFRRAAAHRKTHPDDVPFVDGDPFTNAQEYPDTFRAGRAAVRGDAAEVPVTFRWRATAETKTVRVELRRRKGRWLISNLTPEGGADLLKLLRRPAYDSDVR